MRDLERKSQKIAAGMLLVCAGVGGGVLASSLTTDSIQWRPAARFVFPETAPAVPTDQAGAGRSWAQTAFSGGLRRCPALNPAFLKGCEAEMKALQERPALPTGSYGGPLLITKVEPATPEPDFEPYQPDLLPAEPAWRDTRFAPALDVSDQRTPDNYPAMSKDEPPPEPPLG